MDLERIVKRAGGTPLYVYDRDLIKERVRKLRSELPSDLELHYAVKANPMPAVVACLAPLVDGFDVASVGEMQSVLNFGAIPENVSFAGPAKSKTNLLQAIAAGVTIHVESFREVDDLMDLDLSESIGPIRVAIRVNPNFEQKGSGMKMSGGPKPFGVDAERGPELIAKIRASGLQFKGFHFFVGSQNLNASVVAETQRKCLDLARELIEPALREEVTLLNLGGGIGIPYFDTDQPFDLPKLGHSMDRLVHTAKGEFPKAKVVLELGRYMVGEAGRYITRVIDKKVSRGKTYLVVDGGMNHHLAATGNLGQLLRRNYPVSLGEKREGAREVVTVVGPLCTPLDVLAEDAELAAARVGDLIVISQSGAYGPSASPRDFLSHPPAREVLVGF
ncbi:MAG: pyridoxal-dependent decarboxylase, exosortase A system-associated [Bdellovibrionales bacterium]|nr:pyridoxal-dependent decarboxylase, exosortase A system-associated [Bdellovibrionales bacterium]